MIRVLSEILLLPPTSGLLLLLLGAALRTRRPRTGRAILWFAFAWLWLSATPAFGGTLLRLLQSSPALPHDSPLPVAQAIVVLSAESDPDGAEYGGAVAGPMTMQRLRYGAWLQRRTGLPLLVSGGVPASGRPSLAAMMADAARAEFGVDVRWREERSATTRENAAFSAPMLRQGGVRSVFVVTSAWHMPRAKACFAREGLEAIAAPTGFRGPAVEDWTSFVPRAGGLRDTCLALHELGGLVAYSLTR